VLLGQDCVSLIREHPLVPLWKGRGIPDDPRFEVRMALSRRHGVEVRGRGDALRGHDHMLTPGTDTRDAGSTSRHRHVAQLA
jgi:hypothetical protein